MFDWIKRLFAKPPAKPSLPNAHYLGIHIAETTRKAGYRW